MILIKFMFSTGCYCFNEFLSSFDLRMKKILIILLFIITGFPVVAVAQNYILNGIVVDQARSTPIAFVKIGINNNKYNTVSDINGLFSIRLNEPIRQLLIVNPGYQSQSVDVSDKTSPLVLKLVSDIHSSDSLAAKRLDIYHYIDSMMHIDQYAEIKRRQESMLSGEIPIGWFSLDVSKLKRYNSFEGFYLGVGGYTNEKQFQSVSLGGFVGYGFKDKKTKHGFDVSVWPDKLKHLTFNVGYSYDTQEGEGSQFFDDKSEILDPSSFRSFYVDKMNYEERVRFSVTYKLSNVVFYGAVQQRIINPGYDVLNGVKVLVPPQYYNVSGIISGIRWSPGKSLNPVPGETDSKVSDYPVLWLQVTEGIQGMRKAVYNYNRFEGKIHYAHNVNHLGRSSLLLIGNYLDGKAPYFEYFNGRGSYGNFGLYASGSFVTMHPNEFLNDRSIGLFFTHTFGNFFPHTEIFNPFPALVFNYGWGKLKSSPSYFYLPVTDMHLGFVEAGVQINNLLDLKVYGVGLGAYYRMGAYCNSSVKDNIVFKIVVSFPGKD
jgi:hypothetical protein